MNISYDIVLLGESPMLKIHGFIGVSYIRYEPTALATKNLEISTKVALDKAHTWAEILGRENKNKGGGTDSGKYDRTPYNVRECNWQSVTNRIGKLYLLPVIICREKGTNYRRCLQWFKIRNHDIRGCKGHFLQNSAATPEIRCHELQLNGCSQVKRTG